jgi:GNAT superfamily N-acetyltransferase
MKEPAEKLIAAMDEYLAVGRVPVRLALEADSGFEVSIQRLATFPDSLRQGYASDVMGELVKAADRFGVVIGLEALPEEQDDPDDDIDLGSLVEFYRRFGFEGDFTPGDESVWMGRNPGKPSSSHPAKMR